MAAVQDRIDKMQRQVVICLLILIVISLNAGCTAWSPSDDEAVRLVKGYYLFFYSGKEVEVKIIHRGKYIKEDKCFPVEFLILPPGQESFKKTFYFFRDEQGSVAVREFQFGQQTSS